MLFEAESIHPDPDREGGGDQGHTGAAELQTFLGIATYMAPFIPNVSALSQPLTSSCLLPTRHLLRTSSSRSAVRYH